MNTPEPQETHPPLSGSQFAATVIVATILFTLLYIYLKIAWLVLLPIAMVGVITLPKQASAKLFRQRLGIFAISLILSFFIGISWVTFA